MSTFNTENIESLTGGAPNFSQGLNVGGAGIATLVTLTEFYDQASQPSSPSNGAVWWDGTNMYQYMNAAWRNVSVTAPPTWFGDKAVFATGYTSATVDSTAYVQISTPGNATTFSTLTLAATSRAACSNGANGYFGGGTTDNSNTGSINVIDYITFSTSGTATDFGDLTVTRTGPSACSDGVKGVFGGGQLTAGTWSDVIDYITIATPGNAVDFGDLTLARPNSGCAGNGVRGVFGGGGTYYASRSNIDYITIATASNATVFGSLPIALAFTSACSDDTYVVFGGGVNNSGGSVNTINYVTIETLGNATNFGNLTSSRGMLGATSNNERGVFAGGLNSSFVNQNTIDYITITTTGNATDFGDLVVASRGISACSGD